LEPAAAELLQHYGLICAVFVEGWRGLEKKIDAVASEDSKPFRHASLAREERTIDHASRVITGEEQVS